MALKINKSIVTRVVAFVVLLVVADALVRYFLVADFLREDLTRVVAQQQESLANYVARDIDDKVNRRQQLLQQLADSLPQALLDDPPALSQWLGERFRLQSLFTESLFVTDPTGLAIADFPVRPERRGVSYGDRDYVQGAAAGRATIGSPLLGRFARKPVLPMSVPVLGKDGRVRAVLAGITGIDSSGFLAFQEQSRIGLYGGFLLISPRDKLFVAASQAEMALKPTPAPGVNPLHDKAMAGYRGSGVTINAKGREEISGIASVPSTGWFVVARISTEEALATVARTQRYLRYSSVLVVVVFAVLATLGLLAIFRPVYRAARHADRMTLGEVALEPLPLVRQDEIGYLTAAFNRLLARLLASQAELQRAAHHDALTGLANRFLLADRLGHALARSQRNGKRIALLYLDLDGFKPINDQLGHDAGDLALAEVARRLGSIVREADTLARIGGDEFMVLMDDLDAHNASAEAAASTVATKCLEALRAPFVVKGQSRRMTASIGVAISNADSTDEGLQRAADEAMYGVKRAGGDSFLLAASEPEPQAA
jgi:diguanylate cyclase (GGDEF)-like protein